MPRIDIRKELIKEGQRIINLRNISQQSHEACTRGGDSEDIQAAVSTHIGDANNVIDVNGSRLPCIQRRFAVINDALNKICKGIYGICEDCGEEIPRKRLLAHPAAKRCLDCQEKKERNH